MGGGPSPAVVPGSTVSVWCFPRQEEVLVIVSLVYKQPAAS